MLSRINMAKSSYQLHNGQATWLRSEQHHLQRKDVCMCIYSRCVCVCSPSCNLFRIRAGEWVYTPVCVIGIVSMCAYLGSFNQRPIVRRYGGPVSLSFCSDKTACQHASHISHLRRTALLPTPHLTAAHTDSTLLQTSMILTPPEEGETKG